MTLLNLNLAELIPMEVSKYFMLNGCKVVTDSNEILKNGDVIKLTPKEKDILVFLYRNRGRTVSRSQILATVWGDSLGNDSGLTQAISKLRHVFGDDPKNPKLIKTIPKMGYQLITDSVSWNNSEKKRFNLVDRYNNMSAVKKFGIKSLIVLLIITILMMIFDINIRIEQPE